jgi:spore coat protein U-like protein
MQSRVTMIRCGMLAGLMLTMGAAHGVVSCTVTTVPLSFGTYDPFAAAHLDVATQATITCTTNRNSGGEFAVVTSAISKGGAPTFSPRQMRNALNNTLDYNLFTTTGRTTIFGFAFVTNRFTPAVIRVDVFGRVFAGQDASVGAYTDTLNYTITF